MKFKINTTKLQEMVARSIKGVGNRDILPLTSMMGISLEDGKLTLTTTDGVNYLYISEEGVDGDDFNITVPVDKFAKLIARTTSETISLELQKNSLLVHGNGKYSIELQLDENGDLIDYPNPLAEMELENTAEIKRTTVADILTTVKPSVATTLEEPCYTGYYVGDSVVATNSAKVAWMAEKVLDEPKLISQEMMNLLAVMTSETIDICVDGDVVVFYTDDCVIYGNEMAYLDDFPIDKIAELVDMKFGSMCQISRNDFLHLLDRLSIFVGAYDKNAITLNFLAGRLDVSSKQSDGIETVQYLDFEGHKDFECTIDIELLTSQIKSQNTDVVELYYGNPKAVKMVYGNITQIIALMQKR